MTRTRVSFGGSAFLLIFAVGCSVREAACGPKPSERAGISEAQAAALTGAPPPLVQIAVLGDSIAEGFGLTEAEAFPALLQQKFAEDGYDEIEIVNAGVTGDTSAAALRRLEWTLERDVRILVVALGANDALRGQSPVETKANLSQIIRTAQQRGVLVLLTGMEAPPNMGSDYAERFRAIFPQLVAEYNVKFLPFLLQGVAGQPQLNQSDGIHPTAEGQAKIAELIYPILQPMADDVLSR